MERFMFETKGLSRRERGERRRPGKDESLRSRTPWRSGSEHPVVARDARGLLLDRLARVSCFMGRKSDRSGGGCHRGMRERPHRVTTGPRAPH